MPVNETAGGNETIPVPIPINETQTNQTVPIPELPVTNETQNATVEPEPIPPTNGNGGNETQTEPGPTPTEPPFEESEPQLNATESFTQLENATAILDQKLDEVFDNGNDTNRGELKALVGDTLGSMGDVSDSFVNATSDQMLMVQGTAVSVSESIDEILAADDQRKNRGEEE